MRLYAASIYLTSSSNVTPAITPFFHCIGLPIVDANSFLLGTPPVFRAIWLIRLITRVTPRVSLLPVNALEIQSIRYPISLSIVGADIMAVTARLSVNMRCDSVNLRVAFD